MLCCALVNAFLAFASDECGTFGKYVTIPGKATDIAGIFVVGGWRPFAESMVKAVSLFLCRST